MNQTRALSLINFRIILGGLLVSLLSVLFVLMSSAPASAITNVAPDPSEYGAAGDDIRLALSNVASSSGIRSLRIPVYVRAPVDADPNSISAQVRLDSVRVPYETERDEPGGTLSRFRIWFTYGDRTTGRCLNGSGGNMTLTVRGFRWSEVYRLWYSAVETILVRDNDDSRAPDECHDRDGSLRTVSASNTNRWALILFRMRIQNFTYTRAGVSSTTTSNGNTPARGGNSWLAMGAVTGRDYSFATDARMRGRGAATYTINFATPCDITAATRDTIQLYDLDSGSSSDNDGRRISVSIQDLGPNPRPLNITTSGSMTADNGTYSLTMTFRPEHRYRMTITNMYFWNLLQYRLPYDNIAYAIGCDLAPGGRLTPELRIDPDQTTIPNGQTFDAYFGVRNDAARQASVNSNARVWYDANRNGIFDVGETSVWDRNTTTRDTVRGSGLTEVANRMNIRADMALGNRICVSWQLRDTNTTGMTVDTTMQTHCISISQSALTQIWGNDLRVGGRYASDATNTNNAWIRTALTRANSGRYFGSWTEYGVLAPGEIAGMASGSGLSSGNTSNVQSSWSPLTFANSAMTDLRCSTTGTGCYGDGVSMGNLPDVARAVDSGMFSGVPVTTTCTVAARTVANGIIRCAGTLTITGNITAPTSYANEGDIRQLIIIANNINIQDNVDRIDAWLVATGTTAGNGVINTCSNGPASLTLSTCNRSLQVNGPVIARSLLLRRTHGAAAAPADTPAERFNLRGDTYLWAYNRATQSGHIRTTYVRELAPRY